MVRYIITTGDDTRLVEADQREGWLVEPGSNIPLVDSSKLADHPELSGLLDRARSGDTSAAEAIWLDGELYNAFIPVPEQKLLAEKIYERDFNFSEDKANLLGAAVPFLSDIGEYKAVMAIFALNRDESYWQGKASKQLRHRFVAAALRTNNLSALGQLLQEGGSYEPLGSMGVKKYWPFVEAAALGNIEALKLVFDGMQPNTRKRVVQEVFEGFIATGNADAVELILSEASNYKQPHSVHSTLAHALVRYRGRAALRFAKSLDRDNENTELQDLLKPFVSAKHLKKTNTTKLNRYVKLRAEVEKFLEDGVFGATEVSTTGERKLIQVPDINEHVSEAHPAFSNAVYNHLYPIICTASKIEDNEFDVRKNTEVAYKLAVLFDDPQEATNWLRDATLTSEKPNKAVTQAVDFIIPEGVEWHTTTWKNALKRHGAKISKHLSKAITVEATLTELGKQNSLEQIINFIADEGFDAYETKAFEWRLEHKLSRLGKGWNKDVFREAAKGNNRSVVTYLDAMPTIEAFINRANIYRRENAVAEIDIPSLGFGDVVRYLSYANTLEGLEQNQGIDDERKHNIRHMFYAEQPSSQNGREELILLSPSSLGVELEFYGLNDDLKAVLKTTLEGLSEKWNVGTDSSISPDDGTSGIEVTSPILDNSNIMQLQLASATIHDLGGKVKTPCAMHIHVGINNAFPEKQRLPIIKQSLINYIELEDALSFMDSKLVHRYERTFGGQNLSTSQAIEKIKSSTSLNELMRIVQPGGYSNDDGDRTTRRRGKINLHAMSKFGTIEFRQHPGTTEPNEIMAWTKFVDRFMHQTVQMALGSEGVHSPNEKEQADLQALVYEYLAEREPTARTPDYPKRSVLAQTAFAERVTQLRENETATGTQR